MKTKGRFTLYLVVAGIAFLWLIKVPVLSLYISHSLRLPISIGWMAIWPTETTIRQFRIDNPKGFQDRHALSAKIAGISYELPSLFATPSVINEIFLEEMEIDVHFINSSENNWTLLSAQMPKPSSIHPVRVNQFIAKDITVRLKNIKGSNYTTIKHVDQIELSNLSSERGFPTEEVIRKVFGGLDLTDVIEDAFDPFGLFEGILSQ